MPGPICGICGVAMHCHRNGRAVIFLVDGEPDSLWHGDEFRCPQCDTSVVVGFGRTAIAESWQPEFHLAVAAEERYGHPLRVAG